MLNRSLILCMSPDCLCRKAWKQSFFAKKRPKDFADDYVVLYHVGTSMVISCPRNALRDWGLVRLYARLLERISRDCTRCTSRARHTENRSIVLSSFTLQGVKVERARLEWRITRWSIHTTYADWLVLERREKPWSKHRLVATGVRSAVQFIIWRFACKMAVSRLSALSTLC